ncbi:MAG TPA: radical SAM protein, partial [bacterium]|nr:radical SAM protein [bacterium]
MALDLLLIQCPCWTITHPPMHLAILKAAVQAAGYTCHCWDLSLQLYRRLTAADRVRWRNEDVGFWMSPEAVAALQQRHDAFLQQMLLAVQRKRPRIIGFSAQVTTREFAVQLARRCKQLLPEIPIVFGGIEARSCCSGWRLAAEPAIDYVISGEADGALPALLEALHGRRDLATVPGLLREYQGVRQAVPEQPLAELDAAPFPDYRDFVLADYENPHGLDVIFSRGCVNQCAYCIELVLDKTYRSKSGDYLFREVEHYRAQFPELRELRFSDAAMNGSIREVRKFCERLRQLAVPFTWTGNLIALRSMDRETVDLLRAAGCRAVEVGIESGSPRVQKLMRKHLDLAHAERLIAELAAAGIAVAVNFMAGFPGESEADFRQTLRFFRRVAPRLARVNLWHEGTMLFRGSSMFNRMEEYGIVLDDPGFATPATVWWHTADGENTLGVRQRRFDALRRLARRYALSGIATDTDEQALFLAVYQDYTRRCAAAMARWSDSYYRWVYALRLAWWFPEQEAHLRLPGLPGLVGRWQRWRHRLGTWPEQVRRKQETALRVGGMLSERQAYTGPFHAQIDLTNRCTNQCMVCWFRSPLLGTAAQGYAVRDRELPTA